MGNLLCGVAFCPGTTFLLDPVSKYKASPSTASGGQVSCFSALPASISSAIPELSICSVTVISPVIEQI